MWNLGPTINTGEQIPGYECVTAKGHLPFRKKKTPRQGFDRTWALTLLQSTLSRLRAEYEQGGKLREYERIKPALTALRGEIDYDAIAADLRVLPSSARSVVHRLRKRFRELFREEVGASHKRSPILK